MIEFPYPLISNYKDVQFADKLISYYGVKINTKAELLRLINSFNFNEFIKFEDFKVINHLVVGETYEVNFFIKDEVRDGNISKTLLLQFSKINSLNTYFLRDIISFITSEIQLIYPEYSCVGVLI